MWVIVIREYVLKYWAYRLLFAAGPLGHATKASRCMLPVGPFLLHLFLIQVLHDFTLSRFQKGGNSRLNVNKISFHSCVVQPAAASTLGRKSARRPKLCGAVCWKKRCQPWFCHCLGPGVYRRRPWFPLLPKPSKTKYSRSVALSEYIPPAKIHRPCFLNLAQWSVYLEWKCSERRSSTWLA